MATIKQLSEADIVENGDQFPFFSEAQGDTRKVTFATLKDSVATDFVSAGALAAQTGATLVGCNGGTTVQQELDALDSGKASLSALAASGGSALIGVSGGGTVQDAIEEVEASALPIFSKNLPVVWDDFDRANGLLNGQSTAIGGKTWSITGPGAAGVKILNRRMYGEDTLPDSNFYAGVDYGQDIESMSGLIRFEKRNLPPASLLTQGPQGVLIADTNGALENMLHFQISQNRWIIDYRIGGTWTFGIAGGQIWLEPGAEYLCELLISRLDNSYRCRISGAEGVIVDTGWTVYAPIASLGVLRRAIWQIQAMNPAGDAYIPSWAAPAVGPFIRNGLPITYGDTPRKEGRQTGFTRYRFETWTATNNNYWRILDGSTLSGFLIEGTLNVHCRTALGAVFNASYRVYNRNGATNPIIAPLGREILFGTLPMTIRASNDAGAAAIDIAWTNAATDNVIVDIEFVGAATPANFFYPKSGLSALTGNSVLYTPAPATTPDFVTAIISANGYHSVISQSTFAAGGGIQGFFDVEVTRVDTAVGSRIFMYVDQYGAVGLKPMTLFPMYPSGQTVDKVRISRFGGNVRVDVNLPDAAAFPVVVRVRRLSGEGVPVIAAAASPLATENLEQTLQIATPTADFWNGVSGIKVANTQVVGARGAAVADATGGATVDAEARAAINTLLSRIRAHGLIAP